MLMARAARAVPRRAWRRTEILVILASSHRNDGDTIAASDTNDRAGGHGHAGHRSTARGVGGIICIARAIRRLRGDAAALEARHVTTGYEGRVVVRRPIGNCQQHLTLFRRIGAGRYLYLTRG